MTETLHRSLLQLTRVMKVLLPRQVHPFAKRVRRRVFGASNGHEIHEIDVFAGGQYASSVGLEDIVDGRAAPERACVRATFFVTPDREAWRAAWRRLGDERCAALLREADEAVAQRFDLLGSGPAALGREIDWQADFKSGGGWRLVRIAEVTIAEGGPGSDIKVPWELSRFYHAPVLGVAHLLTDDARYADAFVAQVGDWIRKNPVGYGANWVCAMEVAVRAGNWLVALPYFGGAAAADDEFMRILQLSLFEHGRYIRGHLEGTVHLRSNHYLADLQGLVYLGLQFPESEEAREWVEFARGELEREMAWEVYPDGTDFEASTAYHRLCLELLLGPAVIGGQPGVGVSGPELELSDAFWTRLHGMFRAVRSMLDASGRVPLIGDNDSGRLHRMAIRDDADLAYLLPIGAVLFDDPELKLPGVPFSEEALLHLGPDGQTAYEALATGAWPSASTALPDSGWYTLRHGDECLHVSCGPNGQRFFEPAAGTPEWNGGHAHNDKLSICYTVGKTPVLVDPGQYCYTSDQALRNLSRATSAHNVAQVDGLEQQRLKSDYLFNVHDDRAQATVRAWEPDAADGPRFEGEHRGYVAGSGVVCRRRIEGLPGAGFRVTETFEPVDASPGDEIDVTINLHAAAGLDIVATTAGRDIVATTADRWRFGSVAEVAIDGAIESGSPIRAVIEDDFVSPAYGRREAARVLRLLVRVTPPTSVTWTLVPLRENADAWPTPARPRPGALDAVPADLLDATRVALERIPPRPSVGPPVAAAGERRGLAADRPVVYARLDYWNNGAISGGSVGHTANVVRTLDALGRRVHVATGFYFPMIDPTLIPVSLMPAPNLSDYRDDHERQFFAANHSMARAFGQLVDRVDPAFIYERIVVGSSLAAGIAHERGVPYIVEYNGSEIWARRHWARDPYRHEKLMRRVEQTVLAAADLVVVVSDPLREELIERGLHPERILVNPNAVDAGEFDRARWEAEARRLRDDYGIGEDAIVVGFIGTFGAWHGIPTLARALSDLAAIDPRVRVLLIGDGHLRSEIDAVVARENLQNRVILTGSVPQDRAPVYLSMCDLFLSPHQTPPDDKRPFFGSPTKLLEYMAMGRPTVASDLGQIGSILQPALRVEDLATADEGGTNAIGVLVEPGDAAELTEAVRGLVRRPDLGARLAANAKQRVLERHCWSHHVGLILERLERVLGS